MSEQNKGESTVQTSGEETTQQSTVTKTPEELQKIAEDQKKRAEKAESELKTAKEIAENATKEAEEAKKQLQEAGTKGDMSDADISKIAEEFDVDPKFAQKLADAISSMNKADIKKAQDELQSEITKRDTDAKKKAFEDAFDKAYTTATTGIEATIDKDAVKTVFLERVKSNTELTIAEVIEQMYPTAGARSASEDETRGGGEGNGVAIDFDTASKDPKKLSAIMADPVAKSKYYAWRDKQNI